MATCLGCQGEMEPKRVFRGGGAPKVFCNRSCRTRFYARVRKAQQTLIRRCKYCGADLTGALLSRKRIYCDGTCRDRQRYADTVAARGEGWVPGKAGRPAVDPDIPDISTEAIERRFNYWKQLLRYRRVMAQSVNEGPR